MKQIVKMLETTNYIEQPSKINSGNLQLTASASTDIFTDHCGEIKESDVEFKFKDYVKKHNKNNNAYQLVFIIKSIEVTN